MSVYLDYNSTTPLAKSVQEVIKQSLNEHWANPSSNSTFGQKAKQQIEDARNSVGAMIGAKAENIIFTSGGTEVSIHIYKIVIKCIFEDYNQVKSMHFFKF